MSAIKKKIRLKFRHEVLERDGHKCRICGVATKTLDAHHIIDRKEMPNGGYVKENGITLCSIHHRFAETFHNTGAALEGWHPDDLFKLIGSSQKKAITESKRLSRHA